MKRTKYILLFIGSAGLASVIFGLVNGDPFQNHLMTIVCGASLIFGYFQINNQENKKN